MDIKIELLERNKGQIPGVPKNPRKQSKAKLEALKKSIIELPEMLELRELLVYPLGDKYVIVGGNMRYRALLALGYKSAPCKVLAADTPPEKIKAIVLQDNNSFGEDDYIELLKGYSIDELNALSYDLPKYVTDSLPGTEDTGTGDGTEGDQEPAAKPGKHKTWGKGERQDVARCDMKPRYGIVQRAPYYVVHSFARSEEGTPLTEIKTSANVSTFAAAACTMLNGLLSLNKPANFALITAPPRWHKDWNFAQEVCGRIAHLLRVHFYPGAFVAHNANRIKPDFELREKIAEDNVIIYDDILTTGSTLRNLAKFFPEKNVILIVGINNN